MDSWRIDGGFRRDDGFASGPLLGGLRSFKTEPRFARRLVGSSFFRGDFNALDRQPLGAVHNGLFLWTGCAQDSCGPGFRTGLVLLLTFVIKDGRSWLVCVLLSRYCTDLEICRKTPEADYVF